MHHDGSGFLGALALLFVAALGLVLFLFWIRMLVDAIKNPRLSEGERIAWVLVIIFLQILGAIIYAAAGRRT